jgi:hypothetical protein
MFFLQLVKSSFFFIFHSFRFQLLTIRLPWYEDGKMNPVMFLMVRNKHDRIFIILIVVDLTKIGRVLDFYRNKVCVFCFIFFFLVFFYYSLFFFFIFYDMEYTFFFVVFFFGFFNNFFLNTYFFLNFLSM